MNNARDLPEIADQRLLGLFQSLRPITTLGALKRHLQLAIEIEHATLPPYLAALYTLRDTSGHNAETRGTIARIVYEEMLHFALACNLINAVGGQPRIAFNGFVPQYPTVLPGSVGAFVVSIEKASDTAFRTFERIEHPHYPVEGYSFDAERGYQTIGEFYLHIRYGFARLNFTIGPHRLFNGDPARQVTYPADIFAAQLFEVRDLATATAAIDKIVIQGEGTHPPQPFVPEGVRPHYYAFRDIQHRCIHGPDGRILPPEKQFAPNLVEPMVKNPRLAGDAVHVLSEPFNKEYWKMLQLLQDTFNGQPSKIADATWQMAGTVGPAFQTLVKTHISGGSLENAGPTFDFSQIEAQAPDFVEQTISLVMRDPEVKQQGDFKDYPGGPITYPNGLAQIVRKWDMTVRCPLTLHSPIQVRASQTYTNGGGPNDRFEFPTVYDVFEDTPHTYEGVDAHGCIVLHRSDTAESIYDPYIPSSDPFPDPDSIYDHKSVRQNGRWCTLEWDIHVVADEPQLTVRASQQPWVSDVALRRCPSQHPFAALVSFARDIRPLFTDEDVQHMMFRFDLSSYDDVKNNSAAILDRVSRQPDAIGIMPPPPREPWTTDQVNLFSAWIAGGFQP